ncbi:MAG: hypothetical protein ACOZAO_00660 [Patescibacteria group bacterium]
MYNNEPYVVQLPDDENTVMLVDINNGSEYSAGEKISIEEARERDLPTLRDLLVGQIVTEIKWVPHSIYTSPYLRYN